MRRKINWRQGNSSMILGCMTCVVGMVIMLGVMESINLFQGATVAQTRADLSADGSAAYGANYDSTLGRGRVALMSSVLLAANADYDNPIALQVDYGLLPVGKVHTQVTVQRTLWFPRPGDNDTFRVTREAVSRVIPTP